MQSQVLPSLRVRHLSAGQFIWRQGDMPQHWVGVLGGAAKLCVAMADGRAVTLCSAAGSWIGEAALLQSDIPHTCDAVALHDLTAVFMPKDCFDLLRVQVPAFADFLLRLLAERNVQLMELLAAQQQLGTQVRVARCLGALITPMNFPTPKGRWLNVPQSELADFCQVSRSRLSEALTELHSRGLIAVGYRCVQILDLQGLRSFEAHQDRAALMN